MYQNYQSKISINEQDRKVAELLREKCIRFSVSFVGNNADDPDWSHDLWRVVIGENAPIDFKTGIGLRVKGKVNTSPLRALYGIQRGAIVTIDQWNKISAVMPTQASILYCLLSDAEANETSYNDWCDMLGFDSDSFTAFRTYQQCCEIGQNLRKVFNHETMQTLREILEDY